MKKMVSIFIILSLGILLFANHLRANDKWSSTGNMNYVRQNHTATLLQNGKVLIVGWDSNIAELYDPATNSFQKTGSTTKNYKQGSTATLLNDGKVLIVGGTNAQKNAEIFDPATGLFSLVDTLKTKHCYHTATLLTDGRVLIAGGQENTGPQTHAICEIFNPLTGVFSLTGSLNIDRSSHAAVLLPDGQVLITGGLQTTTPGNANFIKSCELFDPTKGTFTQISDMSQPRANSSAILLNNGKVLVTGGAWYAQYGELYDLNNGSWTSTGTMTRLRRNSSVATLLQNGLVLIVGGFNQTALRTAEFYNPETNTFSVADSMNTPRMTHTVTTLADGSVLVAGGYDGKVTLKLAERLVITTSGVANGDPGLNLSQKPPATFSLSQNYPNPFNPETNINYYLPHSCEVRIGIYNLRGEIINILLAARQNAGEYQITWDGKSANGAPVVSGVYLVRMVVGNLMQCRKIILLK
ncbi:T9SS type A sorting domain-containing protein [candidate division KSB1 bacterium]|nr:T9SS type A sorting domain-containing protein [candidate division KSB1 bacterium]